MAEAQNPFDALIERYADDPVLFVQEVLGGDPTDYQAEFLRAVARGERKISVRSGHGTGKSTAAAWAMLHFVLFRFPCKIVVTAPTSAQLFDALFAELVRWINALPPTLRPLLNVTGDRVELAAAPEEAFISARTSRAETPEAMAGVHSQNVLLVVDEASGVPEQVFEAAVGSMSGEHATTVLLGNPTRTNNTFHLTHTKLRAEWWTRRWSCLDSPLVSEKFIEEVKLRYGEESNAYRVRVLGEFPQADDDTIIPLHLAMAAVQRDVVIPPGARHVWALDVARFGSDRTVLAKREGDAVLPLTPWRGLDLMQTVGRVHAEWNTTAPSARPEAIFVDSIGVGAGVVDRLRELGLPVRGINVSEAPAVGVTYHNLRVELLFKVKQWLEGRSCLLPDDDELVAELTSIRYSFMSTGKMKAESKDDMKRRGLPSPDKADAVCLLFAGDAVTAMGGHKTSWSKPLRRNLGGVV